jgi:hypothetical protein
MVNQSLIAIERAAFAPRHSPQAFLSAYSPNQHIVTFIHDGARDEQVGTEDQKQYEIPSNFSVHDFVRRAVSEANLVISEFEKTQAENGYA